MTLHTWTTAADVPPSAWAAMTADVDVLLASWAQVGGATVTGPSGAGPAVLDGDSIAFAITLPGAPSLAVTFTRAAGKGSTSTNGHVTDGLVVVALTRAALHWGALLTWSSEASTAARAVAEVYGQRLFADGDRALAGLPPLAQAQTDPAGTVAEFAQAAVGRVQAGAAATYALDTLGFLAALIVELQAEHDGRATAAALLAPAPTAVTSPAAVPVAAAPVVDPTATPATAAG